MSRISDKLSLRGAFSIYKISDIGCAPPFLTCLVTWYPHCVEDKIVWIESQSGRDNLLIDVIEESDNEDYALKVQQVFTNMKL